MQSGGDRGLTTAEVAERVADGRVNRVDAGTGRTVGEILRANLVTPVNAIMVTLFVVIVAAGYPRDGLFVGVVVSNVVIGVWQELKARRELHRLAVLNAASATAGEHAGGDTDPRLERVLEALGAIANSDPDPNPTMLALRTALPAGDWTLVASRPFSSATKWSATQFAGHGAFYLGAHEILFAGDDAVLDRVRPQSERGYRVLGLAHSDTELGDDLPSDAVPLALILFEDDIRPDAPEILKFFHDQGVTIKVISGDNVDTVAAVADRAGVFGADRSCDARTLPGEQAELARVLESTTVFGRVTPHQKRAMVDALKADGHVVAMTGDGVNDVLALKDADMGIAMGSGSAASRGVAQLVLLDDRFATLPDVLAEGRRVINNIERVANLFVSKAVYAVLLALLIGIQQVPFPLLPRQLTLVGTFSIGIPGVFLALASSDALVKPGFLRRVLAFSVPAGTIAGCTTWLLYALAEAHAGTTLAEARSVATFTLLLLGLVILVVASRPLRTWKIALAVAMGLGYVAIGAIRPLRDYFVLDPSPAGWWLAIAGAAVIGGGAIALIPWATTRFTRRTQPADSPS